MLKTHEKVELYFLLFPLHFGGFSVKNLPQREVVVMTDFSMRNLVRRAAVEGLLHTEAPGNEWVKSVDQVLVWLWRPLAGQVY